MCLAIPMKIKSISDEDTAIAELSGVERQVCISLLTKPEINDYILVHAGLGIEKVDEEEALKTLELLNEMYSYNDEKPK